MTRLLRKLRELFAGLYSAITMPRWNPYGGQAREACGLPLACVICGKDSAENISRVCDECRILAREGHVRPPKKALSECSRCPRPAEYGCGGLCIRCDDERWRRLFNADPRNRKVVKGPWS